MQADGEFGFVLKQWRRKRRMSQLDLGLEANVSSRHISFLETGRARPSRQMALLLGEALDMPRATRNHLLETAGYSAVFRARPAGAKDMASVRAAIDWMLVRHDPYPALALDRLWVVQRANCCAMAMMEALGLGVGDSLLDRLLCPGVGSAVFENWPEVARHMLARLRTESAHLGGEPVLDAAIRALADDPALDREEPAGPMPAFVPARYRMGGIVLSLMSTIAQFGTAEDIALADLRIELMFPADEPTKTMLERLGKA